MSGFWTDDQVRAALGVAAAGGPALERAFSGVSTDTRTLEAGALYVALRGENFDGHQFLGDAAARGAAGAVVDRRFWDEHEERLALRYWAVEDTLEALGALGRHRRRALGARVCAITGTNGKTTTKEMARAILGTRYRVHATTANLNNLVGTPLTLLATPDDAEAVVVEVGTNAPGEIARLAAITEPDAGIITTVGEGHLEGLRSVEGVLEEKTALVEGVRDGGVTLVGDAPASLPERARERGRAVRVAGSSERADEDLRASDPGVDDEGRATFRWRGHNVRLRFRGRHNITNALLALGLADAWGVPAEEAVRALEQAEPFKMRGELRRIGEMRVLVDCYNANPPSTRAALELLASLPRGGGRVAVLGSMLELGGESGAMHRAVAEDAADLDLDLIVATGDFAGAFEPLAERLGARLLISPEPEDAAPALGRSLSGDEVVLLKGSRGVALERLLPTLEQAAGAAADHPPEA